MSGAPAGQRRWIWIAAAVVVLAPGSVAVARAMTANTTGKPQPAATAAVDKGPVTTEVATTGTVQPAQTRSLSFAVAGTVDTVDVRPGTTVTAGQVLARVDDTDAAEIVDNARDSLADARDALADAQEKAKTHSTPTTTTCGANVPAAYTSPSASPAPSSPAPTRSAAPTATRTAKPSGPTTPPRPTCTTGTPQGDRQGGGGGGDAVLTAEKRVTQATTALAKAEDALDGATIEAPIAGRVLTVGGKVGSQVSAGTTFITLADVYDMQISADFPEADADRLGTGQKAVVTLADRPGTAFKATVVQVDPVGTSDGTMVRFAALLAFGTAPKDLLVGQSAAVRVTTGSKDEVVRVPSAAVHDVAGDSGTVLRGGARTRITIGLRGDQFTEVTSGLTVGDEVVRSW